MGNTCNHVLNAKRTHRTSVVGCSDGEALERAETVVAERLVPSTLETSSQSPASPPVVHAPGPRATPRATRDARAARRERASPSADSRPRAASASALTKSLLAWRSGDSCSALQADRSPILLVIIASYYSLTNTKSPCSACTSEREGACPGRTVGSVRALT